MGKFIKEKILNMSARKREVVWGCHVWMCDGCGEAMVVMRNSLGLSVIKLDVSSATALVLVPL